MKKIQIKYLKSSAIISRFLLLVFLGATFLAVSCRDEGADVVASSNSGAKVVTNFASKNNATKLSILTQKVASRAELLDEYAKILRQNPLCEDLDFGKVGSVMEGLVLVAFSKKYPADKFEIITGVQYFDTTGRTIGELDLVVLNKASNDVQVVGEVKVSKNLARAGKKADSQIRRFQNYLSEDNIAKIAGPNARAWQITQFENILSYIKVGNNGAVAAGFDYEIDLERDEADILQQRLLQKMELAR